MKKIGKRISKVEEWFTLQSGAVPYVVGFGLRQWTEGLAKRYPNYPLMTFCGMAFFKNGSEAYFITDEEEYIESFRKILEKPEILDLVYDDFLQDEKNFLEFLAKIENQGEDFLQQNFEEFVRLYDAEYISAVVPDGVLLGGEIFLEEMLKKYPESKEDIENLVVPYGETFAVRYHRELLGSAIRLRMKTYSKDELLQEALNLQKKYHWMHNNYKNVKKIPVEFFLRELKNVLEKASVEIEDEYRDLDISVEKHVLECEEINSKKIIESFDFQRLLWIGKIAWWVDRRKQYNLIANHHLGLRLEYLCQKYSFKYEDAAFLTPAEIDKVISGNLNISDFSLNERKNGGILLYDYQGKEIFLVGDEASKVWKNISSDVSRFADAKEIKGKTGFRGLVSGKVRIIMDAHNSENFQEGEILVTGMTRPDFLQLMKLAAAIITDEGGITCHAAIVAREMKKPCIIGTKIATKVLCDGDFVEIDAENGIVRITKKN